LIAMTALTLRPDYLSEGSMALLYPPAPVVLPTPPTADQEVIETPELATA
jgi:hypothetical protein